MKNKIFYLITVILGILIIVGCKGKEKYVIKMLTFNDDVIIQKEVEEGETIKSLPTPQKDGYAFGGWYYDYNFTEEVTFPFTVKDNMIIYAGWFSYLNFELNDAADSYIVTGINYPTYDVVVPAEFKNKPVISIASEAFDTTYYIKSITLPNSIKEIGDYAFYNCVNLVSINLPDSIELIGKDIFGGCSSLSYQTDHGLKYINNWLIDGTSAEMSGGVIKDSTVGIFSGAFKGNETLKEFTIPNNVKRIYEDTFKESGISKLIIGDSVEYIDTTALSDTSLLKEIEVSNNNKHFSSIDNVLFNKDMTELIHYPTSKENLIYSIPDSVTKVSDRACMYNKYLTTLNLSDNLREIGNQSFFHCDNLTNITFNDSLEKIGNEAFRLSKQIKKLLLPSSVKEIGENAFQDLIFVEELSVPFVYDNEKNYTIKYLFSENIPTTLHTLNILGGSRINADSLLGIKNVKNVMIASSINVIEEGAFVDGQNITNITIEETNDAYKSIGNVIYSKDGKILVYYAAGNKNEIFNTLNSTEVIGKHAFVFNGKLKQIVLNDGLKEIHSNAFYNLQELKTLIIPSTVSYTEQDICFITPNVEIYIYEGIILDNWSEGWNTLNYKVHWNAIFPTFTVTEREFHLNIGDTYELIYILNNAPTTYNVIITVENELIAKVENNIITGLSDGITNIHLIVEGYPTSDFVIILHVGN